MTSFFEDILRAKQITDVVLAYWGKSFDEITGDRRQQNIRALQTCWHLIKKHTKLTNQDICRLFDRERTTVIAGLKNIHEGMLPGITEQLNQIEKQLETDFPVTLRLDEIVRKIRVIQEQIKKSEDGSEL